MASVTMVLFRNGRGDDSEALTAILGDIVRSRADRNRLIEVDVQAHPVVAARYNVSTTPTILLMKDGEIVDRVVGTPTRILLHTLLDTREPHAATATQVA